MRLWTLSRAAVAVLLLFCSHVKAIPSECDPEIQWLKEEENCYSIIHEDNLTHTGSTGCSVLWDHLNCWPHAQVGETVSQPCPTFLRVKGDVMRNCTEAGWSEPFPPYELACGYTLNNTLHFPPDVMQMSYEYFMWVRIMYSVGYSISLISLIIALTLLCIFRKLHCTRNFIHMQLFLSFILRAAFIFIRDAVLHNSQDYYHCDSHPPGCKVALLLSNYCILANYSWLLVEGHYLHSLIHLSLYSQRKRLHWYISLGWGTPVLIIIVWSVAKYLQENEGCWETRGNSWIWWILRVPVFLVIIVNMVFFMRIIRTLVRKMRAPDMIGNEFKQHRKLAKSTLLLVSLFGVQYALFTFFPDEVSILTFQIWNAIELAMASTQGFIVALLYCFLNGEVQHEIRRRWRRWQPKKRFHGDPRMHNGSLSHSGLPLTQISLLARANNMT
ncbi:secretin receptor [Colossoma macropomum]|uniref:secretin receptor n=1 Tax=Colossoma macropomum TaxID=42526 RepID=UPI001863E712|nr:secretin receptor [Colossoma macropomum]